LDAALVAGVSDLVSEDFGVSSDLCRDPLPLLFDP
jgi:hypothetical protein